MESAILSDQVCSLDGGARQAIKITSVNGSILQEAISKLKPIL